MRALIDAARMFRHTRERFERIERLLEKLIDKPAAEAPAAKADAATVLAEAFGKMANGQAEIFSSLGDLAMKGAARRMGIRGGTRRAMTAERRANGKFLPRRLLSANRRRGFDPECGLCIDPNTRDVTIGMIQAHRQHEAERSSAFDEPRTQEGSQHADDPTESAQSGNYQNGSAPAGPA